MKKQSKIKLFLKNKQLRNRLLITLFLLLIARMLSQIGIPFIKEDFSNILSDKSSLTFYDILVGGAFKSLSITTLNISPFITSGIIIQLLMIVFPSIEDLQRSSETGRRSVLKIGRLLGLLLGIFQALGFAASFSRYDIIPHDYVSIVGASLVLITSSFILIWIGDLITEYGLGNGLSLILLSNIISFLPSEVLHLAFKGRDFSKIDQLLFVGAMTMLFLIITYLTILFNEGIRKIPIQYHKRIIRKEYLEGHIPLKVMTTSIMPIVFASTILSLPSLVQTLFDVNSDSFKRIVDISYQGNWFDLKQLELSLGYLIYLFLIVFFSYFYADLSFNASEINNALKRTQGNIVSVRQGEETISYIDKTLKGVLPIGLCLLIFLCTIPIIASSLLGVRLSLLGTSLIIAVSIIIELKSQVDAYLFFSK